MREWDRKLKGLGVFRSRQAAEVGVSRSTLSWLLSQNQIQRIGPDCYHHNAIEIPEEHVQYVAACTLFGSPSYIGGATTLFHYQIIDEVIGQIWIVVPPDKSTRDPLYRMIRTNVDKQIGIDVHPYFRIASIERAILDAFYFEKKIGGLHMAISAARRALKDGQTSQKALFSLSAKLGWNSRILRHWEAITSE